MEQFKEEAPLTGAETPILSRPHVTLSIPSLNMSSMLQEQRSFTPGDEETEPRELTDLTHETIPEDSEEGDFAGSTPISHRSKVSTADDKDRYPFLAKREGRFSTTSWWSISSRPSFAGLPRRPSLTSIKSTISRVHSELYPEKGSFIAYSLGQSFADLPAPIAQKLYIVTQVRFLFLFI